MDRRVKLAAAVITGLALTTAVASAASSPSVSTGRATDVTESSAVLNGTISPGGASTGYRFEWGLTAAYGATSRIHTLRSRTATAPVHVKATNLEPGTVYHYRLLALNTIGGAIGSDHTFKTHGNPPPLAATGPAAAITPNAATLSAVINPNGERTTYFFRYGTTSAYTAQTIPGVIAGGRTAVNVSQQVAGLQSGTIFHYAVVATNRNVSTPGADQVFMTLPRVAPVPRVRARTRPRHAGRRPFTFTTSGRIVGPRWIPSTFACAQTVTIRFLRGRRTVARTLAPVAPNCTFSAQTVITRLPGHSHTLKVLIRFAGDGYLAAASAPTERVTAG